LKLIGLTKTLLVLVCLAYVVVPSMALAQKSVHCDDPNTGKKKWVKVWRIHAMYKDTSEILENEGIHVLDLEEDAWKTRSEVEGHWVEKNWCGVYVGMGVLDRSLARVSLDADFTMGKFRRIEKWLRDETFTPGQKMQAEKYLKKGATALARGDLEKANMAFNQSLKFAFSLKDAFGLPENLPKYQDPFAGVTYDSSEIEDSCPELAGSVSQVTYLEAVEKLRVVLDGRLVRPIDLGDASSLLSDFTNYRKLDAVGPAARIACALMNKALEVEPDLASVMKRFRRVNELRREQNLPEFRRLKFKELVRQASDRLAVSDYKGAHASLDALLVLFGQPKKPSDYLLN
jgi:hypothetical protein